MHLSAPELALFYCPTKEWCKALNSQKREDLGTHLAIPEWRGLRRVDNQRPDERLYHPQLRIEPSKEALTLVITAVTFPFNLAAYKNLHTVKHPEQLWEELRSQKELFTQKNSRKAGPKDSFDALEVGSRIPAKYPALPSSRCNLPRIRQSQL
jgi:hypothetical protein